MSQGDVLVWRIAADTPHYVADNMSGQGASTTGGRWNRKELPVVYAASSRALACLETVVHMQGAGLPLNRYLVEITIPAKLWNNATKAPIKKLVGWDASPAGKVSIDWGSDWLTHRKSVIALVPSIVVPDEFCVLINPRHDDARQIKAKKIRLWTFDPRIKI